MALGSLLLKTLLKLPTMSEWSMEKPEDGDVSYNNATNAMEASWLIDKDELWPKSVIL